LAAGSTAVGMGLSVATKEGGGDTSALLRGLAAAATGAVPVAGTALATEAAEEAAGASA